jgi:hypothetical protein
MMSDEICFKCNPKIFSDEDVIPKGKEYFYMCTDCEVILPSRVSNPVACSCSNIVIDPDMFRLSVKKFGSFRVLEK